MDAVYTHKQAVHSWARDFPGRHHSMFFDPGPGSGLESVTAQNNKFFCPGQTLQITPSDLTTIYPYPYNAALGREIGVLWTC